MKFASNLWFGAHFWLRFDREKNAHKSAHILFCAVKAKATRGDHWMTDWLQHKSKEQTRCRNAISVWTDFLKICREKRVDLLRNSTFDHSLRGLNSDQTRTVESPFYSHFNHTPDAQIISYVTLVEQFVKSKPFTKPASSVFHTFDAPFDIAKSIAKI